MAKSGKIDATGRTYLSARNHSRHVRWVKRLLPLAAFAGILAIGVVMFASRILPEVGVNLADSTIKDGKLVMANPMLDGFTADKRPYRVTANRAVQDLTGQDSTMVLESLKADFQLKGGETAILTSDKGIFDSQSNRLALDNEAVVTTSGGMRAILGQSDIDVGSGEVWATGTVRVINEETDISSESMQILDGGGKIVFEHNVRVVMRPRLVNKNAETGRQETGQTTLIRETN